MDNLPVELLLSIGYFLQADGLSRFSRTAKRYHAILTSPLYDLIFKCEIPADQKDRVRKGYTRPRRGCHLLAWLKCSILWKSDPVVEAFAACPLDKITAAADVGIFLLHQYAAHGNTRLVDVLLRRGIRVNTKTPMRLLTPLHCAVTSDGNLDTIKHLLKQGADLEARDSARQTALFYAISASRFSNVGHDAGLQNAYEGKAKPKNLKIVRFLLSRGADSSALTLDGSTPLMFAAAYSNSKICQTLIDAVLYKEGNISAQSTAGFTALHAAIDNHRPRNARRLIQSGADMMVIDHEGETPIDILLSLKKFSRKVMNPLLNLADKLVELGPARKWRLRTDPQSQLFTALQKRRVTTLKFLLRFRAAGRIELDIHGPNSTGPAPLRYLCASCGSWDILSDFEMIQLLLTAGATIDQPGVGHEALHLFIRRCASYDYDSGDGDGDDVERPAYYKTLRMLINSTSDINAQDFAGNTALHYAASAPDLTTAAIILREIIERGLTPLRNNNGFTALHTAAEDEENFDVFTLFLHRRQLFHMNSRTNDGETVLHVAARKHNSIVIRQLLLWEADFTLEDKEGHIPLHRATTPRCVAPFIEAGCVPHPNCEWCPSWFMVG